MAPAKKAGTQAVRPRAEARRPAGAGAGRSFLLEGIAHAEFIAGIAKALDAPAKERFRITATVARAKEE